MKSLFSKLNIFVLLVVAFGCNDKELSNLNVTAVKNLYEPLNNKSVVLQSSASASLYFEWEPAKAEDMGMVLYEVVFDREGGDFSNPIYRMASDNNGGYNHATITHKQLNNIAAKADIASGATGKVQWTVYSSKGINEKKAEMTWVLEITRLQGFENVPVDVYITGEGSEAGATVANAQILKSTAAGEFEIYTKLTGGQTYFFTSDRTGSRKFYPEGSVIKEGEQTATAPATGIYKLTLDFTTSSFSMCEVTAVVFIPLWQNEEFLLDYAGNGIWHKVITFPAGWSGNENTDSRYKFRLTDCNAPIDWIFPGNHDNTPDGNDNWWYVAEDPDRDADQWDDGHVWKVADHAGWSNSTYDITFSLNPESAYTHHLFPTTSSITVEPVAALTAPADNSSITLDALSSDISFEWAATQASDGSAVTYAIAFIAESGDFSTPLFTAPSGNGGQDNSVTLTHTQLNSIATDAGIAPGAQGNLKWTVFASRGTDSRQATVTNTLTVTRIAGFDILPEAAYLTGDATEAGTVLSNALPLKKTAAGIFEIYTRLETGKTFSFTDGTAGTPRNFNIVGGKLDETAGQASNVASTAVYKVSLDFNTGGVLFTEITQVAFYYPWDQINVVLTYTGNGVWTGSETPSGWNSDTRYKFKVTAGGTVKDWIGIDYRNAEPDGTDEFYYMKEGNNEGQWTGEDNNMWKIPSAFGGWNSGTFYFTFSLKADEPYTHLITKQ